ncbi:MAG TPA: hypothetical protein VMR98_00585 [Candidatus Polarisedimenticolaceae bacterium]|nr:hypothetical protein [Candidatus Polarisedimenticolaceae bacterium]
MASAVTLSPSDADSGDAVPRPTIVSSQPANDSIIARIKRETGCTPGDALILRKIMRSGYTPGDAAIILQIIEEAQCTPFDAGRCLVVVDYAIGKIRHCRHPYRLDVQALLTHQILESIMHHGMWYPLPGTAHYLINCARLRAGEHALVHSEDDTPGPCNCLLSIVTDGDLIPPRVDEVHYETEP